MRRMPLPVDLRNTNNAIMAQLKDYPFEDGVIVTKAYMEILGNGRVIYRIETLKVNSIKVKVRYSA